MLTTSCPKCEKEVTIPATAAAESRVRCPLCSEEYTLEGIFAEMPPLLELLDAPAVSGTAATDIDDDDTDADAAAQKESGMFSFADPDGEGSESSETAVKSGEEGDVDITLAGAEESVSKSSSFDFGDDSAPAATSMGTGTATARKPRPAKKPASPVKSIIGVILGGLAAAPIAQLTLWYLPGGWDVEQRDPMSVGRSLPSSIASIIVPYWVTDPNGNAGKALEENPSSVLANGDIDRFPTLNGVDNPDDLGGITLGEGFNQDNSNDGNGTSNQKPIENKDPKNESESESENSGAHGQAVSPTSPGVIDPASYSSSDLATKIQPAKKALEDFDLVNGGGLNGTQKRLLTESAFNAMSDLAEVLTFAEEKPAEQLEVVHELIAFAGDSAIKRKFLAIMADLALKNVDREASGILLTATVAEIRKQGQLFETVVNLNANDNPPVSVYGIRDPSGAFKVGDTVVILGSVIKDPKTKIRGYKGPPDQVVWGGYSQLIPLGIDESTTETE